MKAIWKIAIPVNVLTASFTNSFSLPEDARVVHVREQNDELAIWFEVDTEAPFVQRYFQIFGTGTGPIRDGLTYVGTGIFADGSLVLHAYESVSDD